MKFRLSISALSSLRGHVAQQPGFCCWTCWCTSERLVLKIRGYLDNCQLCLIVLILSVYCVMRFSHWIWTYRSAQPIEMRSEIFNQDSFDLVCSSMCTVILILLYNGELWKKNVCQIYFILSWALTGQDCRRCQALQSYCHIHDTLICNERSCLMTLWLIF